MAVAEPVHPFALSACKSFCGSGERPMPGFDITSSVSAGVRIEPVVHGLPRIGRGAKRPQPVPPTALLGLPGGLRKTVGNRCYQFVWQATRAGDSNGMEQRPCAQVALRRLVSSMRVRFLQQEEEGVLPFMEQAFLKIMKEKRGRLVAPVASANSHCGHVGRASLPSRRELTQAIRLGAIQVTSPEDRRQVSKGVHRAPEQRALAVRPDQERSREACEGALECGGLRPVRNFVEAGSPNGRRRGERVLRRLTD